MTKIMEDHETDEDTTVDDIPPPPSEGEMPQQVRTHNRPPRQRQQSDEERGYARGFNPSRRGPRPLDLAQHQDESFLRVSRVKVNQADEEEVGLGFAGMVDDELGYEEEIAKRWGGGSYEVRGMYDGQLKSTRVTIAGKSRPIHRDKADEEDEQEVEWDGAEADDGQDDEWVPRRGQRFRPRDHSPRFERGGLDPYGRPGGFDPYGRPVSPYGGGFDPHADPMGYPRGSVPYGGPPNPYGNPPNPYGNPPNPYGSPPNPYQSGVATIPGAPGNFYQKIEPEKNEELEAMREQLEAMRAEALEARELAAQEREERRIEAERATAREREELLKRELETMKSDSARQLELLKQASERQALEMKQQMESMVAKLSSGKPDMITKMIELQMLQTQQQQAQAERERLDRDTRMREEQRLRREESERQDKERREVSTQRELEWKRDKERQDDIRREEQVREERRREAYEKQNQKVMEMQAKGQQSPEQILTMLKTMIDLNPRQNATSQVMELAQAAMAMRDMLGGNQEAENKWEGMIRTGGEALVGAIETIKGRSAEPKPVQPPVQLQHQPQVVQNQPPQLPGPATEQGVQPDLNRMPGPDDWGRILSYAVAAFEARNDPESTASHMHSMVIVGMQLPSAITLLSTSTFEELKFKVGAMAFMPAVKNSRYGPKVGQFRVMLDNAEASVWTKALLHHLRVLHQGVMDSVEAVEEAQRSVQPERHEPELSSEEFSRRARESEAEAAAAAHYAQGQVQEDQDSPQTE